MKDTSHLSS